MKQSNKDASTITVLIRRLIDTRLPRARRMLEKVNAGEALSDSDIRFLKEVYSDSRSNQSLLKRNPEYHDLVAGFMSLYTEIITKGLHIEKTD